MSLYNLMFGTNPQRELLLAVVGLKECDIERFRDVDATEDGQYVDIYTRTGGGNREGYPQKLVKQNPLYEKDWDDTFDCTYATFRLRVPDEWREDVVKLNDILANGIRPEFGQHLLATLRREPTERDREDAAYAKEERDLRRTRHERLNGHTFVPFDDHALEGALRHAEENDGELRSAWGIFPAVLTVTRDTERLGRFTRVGIRAEWRTDMTYWKHVQEKFGDKYPKAVAAMRKMAENYAQKEVD